MAKNIRQDHNWSVRVTAAANRVSGQLIVEEGWVGVVPVNAPSGTDYELLVRTGLEVEVPFVATATRGAEIYIDGSNVLTLTATSNRRVGRISAIQGQKSTPTGFMRVVLGAN